MSALLVGYARCSTDQQDLTAQRDALLSLSVEADRILSPRPDRHQPRAPRAPKHRGLPSRRHPGGDQARPPGQIAARRVRPSDERPSLRRRDRRRPPSGDDGAVSFVRHPRYVAVPAILPHPTDGLRALGSGRLLVVNPLRISPVSSLRAQTRATGTRVSSQVSASFRLSWQDGSECRLGVKGSQVQILSARPL